jgi:hypothetical protein
MLYAIFEVAVASLGKLLGYLIYPVRGILAAFGWAIIHSLSDAEFVRHLCLTFPNLLYTGALCP